MRVSYQTLVALCLLMLSVLTFASSSSKLELSVDLFISTACPHCQQETTFFTELQKTRPWLIIHRYEINKDKAALEQFRQRLALQDNDDYSVPAVFFCGSHWVGFDKPETTGQALSHGLDYCFQQMSQTGQINQNTKNLLNQWSNSAFYAVSMANQTSPLTFIPLTSLSDALSSCSLFCALAFFAFLCLSRVNQMLINGIFFLLFLGLVHYLQLAYSGFFSQISLQMRISAVIIGLGLISYTFSMYVKKPAVDIASALLVSFTAIVLEVYQQTCTPNFALIFKQWIDFQSLSSLTKGLYMSLYMLLYCLPLLFFMLVFYNCRIRKKLHNYKRRLIYLACYLLLFLAFVLILYPQGLSSLELSMIVLVIASFFAWAHTRQIGPL